LPPLTLYPLFQASDTLKPLAFVSPSPLPPSFFCCLDDRSVDGTGRMQGGNLSELSASSKRDSEQTDKADEQRHDKAECIACDNEAHPARSRAPVVSVQKGSRPTFSVVSFNVLADAYCHRKTFDYCNRQYIVWEYRQKRLRACIKNFDADILCLQEVDHLNDFWEEFLYELGYQFVYKKRGNNSSKKSGGKHHTKQDGCLVAWRRTRFRKYTTRGIDFNSLADASKFSEAIRLRRHNVGQIVVLEDRRVPHRKLIIANCHLFWNPHYEDVKLRQCALLLKSVEDHFNSFKQRRVNLNMPNSGTPASPMQYWFPSCFTLCLQQAIHEKTGIPQSSDPEIILCGDFNSLPKSRTFRYVESGKCDLSANVLEHKEGTSSCAKDTHVSIWDRQSCNGGRSRSTSKDGPEALRRVLVADESLDRVARWLRSVGIDTKVFEADISSGAKNMPKRPSTGPKWDSKRCKRLFNQTRVEKRLLLTRSKTLVKRKQCPPFILVTDKDNVQAFKNVARQMRLHFRKDHMFQRCTKCNGTFRQLEHGELKTIEGVPESLRGGYDPLTGEKMDFFICTYAECAKVYWWGKKSSDAVEGFRKLLQEAHDSVSEKKIEQKHLPLEEDGSGKCSIDANASIRTHAENICSSIVLNHNLALKSAFPTDVYACATNVTRDFTGQIDHIFHSSTLKVVESISATDWQDKDLKDPGGSYLPDGFWPSDHLPLKTTFS